MDSNGGLLRAILPPLVVVTIARSWTAGGTDETRVPKSVSWLSAIAVPRRKR